MELIDIILPDEENIIIREAFKEAIEESDEIIDERE